MKKQEPTTLLRIFDKCRRLSPYPLNKIQVIREESDNPAEWLICNACNEYVVYQDAND